MGEFSASVSSIRFGVFEVDLRAGEITKRGTKVRLQGQPFLLLVTLLKQRGEVVTWEEPDARCGPKIPSLISIIVWVRPQINFARLSEIQPRTLVFIEDAAASGAIGLSFSRRRSS